MEKRTVLAVALSFLVLLLYNSFFIKRPASAPQGLNISQPIENNRVNVTEQQSPVNLPETSVDLSEVEANESIEVIENNELKVEISNYGAKIKSVIVKQHNHKIPVVNVFDIPSLSSTKFTSDHTSLDSVRYTAILGEQKITKSFSLSGNSVNLIFSYSGALEMSKLNGLNFSIYSIDTNNMTEKEVNHADRSLFEYSASSNGAVFRKHNASSFSKKEARMHPGDVDWVGFRDRFYCAVFKPLFSVQSYEIDPQTDKLLSLYITPSNDVDQGGSAREYKFLAYFGLQTEPELKAYESGFERIVSFSNFGIIDWISKFVLKMMEFVHKVIPNWGVAIIFVCIVIYLLMYPLTMQGMKSMRKMQSLQPEMARMKEQYKNNPQRLNKEVMEIYKKNGVNPLGGCFPFILQMPVFIGLYQALWRNPNLNGATFLWIKDLASPDRFLIFPGSLPFVGNELNILPLFMMVVMFLQQKLSTKNMNVTDPAQLSQQKIMSIFFPIMLGVIFYKFSSGLTLYFTIFYMFSTFTQWKMSKVKVEVIS